MGKNIIMVILSLFFLTFTSPAFSICEEYDVRVISISASSGQELTVDLLLIDPQGKRTGFDPNTKTIKEEILCSLGYWDDYYGGTVPPTRALGIRPKIDGIYILQITSIISTNYYLSIYFRDFTGNPERLDFTGVLSAGVIAKYKINYNSTSVDLSKVTPILFDGKGQRPFDVNTFLAYAGPTQAQTTLTAGQTTYDVAIYYGKTILPGTFKATLNRMDITSSFHPKAGTSELVKITLQKGRNTLILSVDGIRDDGRRATDTDRLVFIVP